MMTYSVYLGGALFDYKQLVGNAILAETLHKRSKGQYTCVLPQDFEQTSNRAADIRNKDLRKLIACDLGLFNFDGTELDSGTVVEFIIAKALDIPTVILRSDFRASGDQGQGNDDWNLMCSFFPRVRKIQFNAMDWYQDAFSTDESKDTWPERLYNRIADAILVQLNTVRTDPSSLGGDEELIRTVYDWSTRFPGGGLDLLCGKSFIDEVITNKQRKGLF